MHLWKILDLRHSLPFAYSTCYLRNKASLKKEGGGKIKKKKKRKKCY